MSNDLIAMLRDWSDGPDTDELCREAADALTAQANSLGFLRQISEQQAYEINQQAAEIEALRADAERYRWLRQRLEVREERSMAGSYKDSIYIRVGQSFFDTPTRGDGGYLDRDIYEKECCEFDAAIDAAIASGKAVTP